MAQPLTSVLLETDRRGSRPSLETRVALQYAQPPDTLRSRSARLRDETVLGWMEEALARSQAKRVLDVGCAFGNLLFMLNARIGKRDDVEMIGIDLDRDAVSFAKAFAATVPGYQNCQFEVVDVQKRLPYADNSFASISALDVLEHLPDPDFTLRELSRVLAPGGVLALVTPADDSLFKRRARQLNRLSRGRLHRAYYRGKAAELDANGQPVMEVAAGHDHISEMPPEELVRRARAAGFTVETLKPLSVLSGSAWFDQHPVMLAALLVVEALHERLQRVTWAHSVAVRLATGAGLQ